MPFLAGLQLLLPGAQFLLPGLQLLLSSLQLLLSGLQVADPGFQALLAVFQIPYIGPDFVLPGLNGVKPLVNRSVIGHRHRFTSLS